jgi:adhesin transport system membrane fusion protein
MKQPAEHPEQKGFAALGRLTALGDGKARMAESLIGPLLNRLESEQTDWAREAEYSILESREPGARGLLYVIVVVVVLLLAWSALARIDQVTRGEGKVIPASQLQIVQSTDGGVVRELLVSEGDQVAAGDLLVRIDPTRFKSSFQENEVRIFALQAKIERLNALLNEQAWRPHFDQPLTAEQRLVVEREREFYRESLSEYQQHQAVAREQLSQQRQALNEVEARLQAARQAVRLSRQELKVTRPLLASGAVSEVELLRLERDLSQANGEQSRAEADLERQQAAVEEAKARMAEAVHSARNRWRTELSEASSELNALEEGSIALADRVRSADLVAPVAGTVQRVLYNTPGSVIAPGDAIIEIVPADDRLLVEAKIAPRDIAFLRPGLPATIKLHAYDFAIYGGISARVQHISADTITDERDNTYYLVRAITEARALSDSLDVMPGMTAQLDIITGERTVLSYLLKPILRAKANALGER